MAKKKKRPRGRRAATVALVRRNQPTSPAATIKLCDLHDKVQVFTLTFLARFIDKSRLILNNTLPTPVANSHVMDLLVPAFEQVITGQGWPPVDVSKLNLDGNNLLGAVKGKKLSYLVQFLYERERGALK